MSRLYLKKRSDGLFPDDTSRREPGVMKDRGKVTKTAQYDMYSKVRILVEDEE